VFSQTSARRFHLLAGLEVESYELQPRLGSLSLSSLDLRTLSLSCLQLLLSGDLVSDRLLDVGNRLDLVDLVDLDDLLLGLPVRLPDGLVAALPLGEADLLLDDLAGACEVLVGCLLLPSG
jgi:hypothetical protein